MRMIEFSAGKKRCLAGNVGKKHVALPGPPIVRATHSRHLTSFTRTGSSKPFATNSPAVREQEALAAAQSPHSVRNQYLAAGRLRRDARCQDHRRPEEM